MKTITIRELHQATGQWVRRAAEGEVYVTERGLLVAKIVPASLLVAAMGYSEKLLGKRCEAVEMVEFRAAGRTWR